jgi:replicative DNA helicase
MTIQDSPTLTDEFILDQQDRQKNPDKYIGYRFPMPWFMKVTGGWQRGALSYVYGRAGIGKTSVLVTAAVQMGRDNVRFLYISLEESLHATMIRVMANMENINRLHFRDICLTPTDWANVYTVATQIRKFSGYWADGLFTEKEIVSAINQTKPEVVFIDYLQLMTMPGKTMTEQVAAASKALVRIASGKHTGGKRISVIASAQMNDANQVLGSRDPDRDGDLCVAIEGIDDGNDGILTDKRRFTIRKNRNGTVDAKDIAFFGARSLVGELGTGNNYGPIRKPTTP